MENFEEFVDKYGSHWRAHFAERIRAETRVEARKEGREEAREESRELLRALIRQKFARDDIPPAIEARIAEADAGALTAAAMRLLAAEHIDEVMPG